jgi:hypothetical protein
MARMPKGAPKSDRQSTTKPVLLSGGNPQIAKGVGDATLQAYIVAMPGRKRDVGSRIGAIIVRTVQVSARRSNGTRHCMVLMLKAGSSASIALRNTSAAGRCIRSRPASPSRKKCATSTSTKTTCSTKIRLLPGSSKHANRPANTFAMQDMHQLDPVVL